MKIKVLVFPKDINPYLELLYGHMGEDVEISYFQKMRKPRIINMMLTPFELTYFRLRGYKILHFHWPFPFSFSNKSTLLMRLSEFYLNLFLLSLRMLDYKMIWTVHDLLPHEKTFFDDFKVTKKIADFANSLITLNSVTREELIVNFMINPKKINLIPMGNFIGYYSNMIIKKSKREEIKFLFFGQIKPYKGIEDLVQTFKLINNKKILLNVIGKCKDKNYFKHLHDLAKNDTRIQVKNTYIPPTEVQKLFSESDCLVLPFKEITNSSSAILAFSMGTPIISPLLGMIKDFPENTGIYYSHDDSNGLQKSLLKAVENKNTLLKLDENAYKYAKSLDWIKLSAETEHLYSSLIK